MRVLSDAATAAGNSTRGQFHRLPVAAIDELTPDAVALRFGVPEELRDAYAFCAGQHLTIRCAPEGTKIRRTYSICSPEGAREPRIGVKYVPGGTFSKYVRDRLRVGDQLDVMTPVGRFGQALRTERGRHRLLVGVGSGITPLLSVLATSLERGEECTLVYGNRRTADVMFAEEIADLKNRFTARFSLITVFSREPGGFPLSAGRIDAPKITTIMGSLVDPAEVGAAFLCGPEAMIEPTRAALRAAGVPGDRVHSELFFVGPATVGPPATVDAAPQATATFTLGGRSGTATVAAGESVLAAVLRERADAPFACRGGVCGTCRARLRAGTVAMAHYYALEPEEIDAGYVLTCQSHPTSEQVIVDYDG